MGCHEKFYHLTGGGGGGGKYLVRLGGRKKFGD